MGFAVVNGRLGKSDNHPRWAARLTRGTINLRLSSCAQRGAGFERMPAGSRRPNVTRAMADTSKNMTGADPPVPDQPFSEMLDLPRVECLRLLAANGFGRLAVALTEGAPVIRPVNYVFDEPSQSVVFRTSPGSKLHAVLQTAEAAFEIDGVDEGSRTGWSVIIHGVAEEITSQTDIRRLDALGLAPWAPGQRRRWVRIRARTVTGRRIVYSANVSEDPPA